MSPPPLDMPLDVQKYVGTCLISQKPRSKKKHQQNGGCYCKLGDNDASVVTSGPSSSSHPVCDFCDGSKKNASPQQHHVPTSVNSNSAWTGMPLISLASCKKGKNGKRKDNASKNSGSVHHPSSLGGCVSGSPPSMSQLCTVGEDPDRFPLSKLAQHTQGAPLVFAGRPIYSKRKPNNNSNDLFGTNNGKMNHQFYDPTIHLRGGHLYMGSQCAENMQTMLSAIPAALLFVEQIVDETASVGDCDEKSEPDTGPHSSSSTSDCMSVTSEESSGISEHSLPRIIKPRKRRKKDRKLPNTRGNSGALVTLKPYMPLCYKFSNVQNNPLHLSSFGRSGEQQLMMTRSDNCKGNNIIGTEVIGIPTKYPYPPSQLCKCVHCIPPSFSWNSSLLSRLSITHPFLTPPSSPSHSSTSSSPASSPPPNSLSSFAKLDLGPSSCDVSTSIITSPNGNRDLEIKFLPPRAARGGRGKLDEGSSWSDSFSSESSSFSSSSAVSDSPEPFTLNEYELTASHPPQRPWIPLAAADRRRPTSIFTVMCYNVLCDKYATKHMYGYCPNWALNWEYRRKGIMDEIRHYSADIISLQEIETDQFYNFFLPELKRDGYNGIFSPKSRAKTMIESERKYVDGCAIFFRTSKFSLIKEHLVEFNQLAMANAEGSDDMLNRVMTKDNIGLAALLETKENAWENGAQPDPSQVHQPLLVCTAHIHWDPEYCDVKLIQTMMLMHELRTIVEESTRSFRPGAHKPDSNAIPLLLCGDFNSLPDSGVIEFLTSGRVSADHPDFKDLGYKSCLSKLSSSEKSNEFTHSFKVARAYSDDIMPLTNYTFDFKGTIDYIFFSKQYMNPLGLLGSLDQDWLREHKVLGCPHPHIPSDHFSLLVEFEMFIPASNPSISNGLVLRR